MQINFHNIGLPSVWERSARGFASMAHILSTIEAWLSFTRKALGGSPYGIFGNGMAKQRFKWLSLYDNKLLAVSY